MESSIPLMQEPCSICKGLGQTKSIFPNSVGVMNCLRCGGTGVTPPDIAKREVVITITSFFVEQANSWVSSLDAKTENPDVTPQTVIDLLQAVITLLSNNQFVISNPDQKIV